MFAQWLAWVSQHNHLPTHTKCFQHLSLGWTCEHCPLLSWSSQALSPLPHLQATSPAKTTSKDTATFSHTYLTYSPQYLWPQSQRKLHVCAAWTSFSIIPVISVPWGGYASPWFYIFTPNTWLFNWTYLFKHESLMFWVFSNIYAHTFE